VTKRFFGQGEQISGGIYFFTRDHLGSVREMTDNSQSSRVRYDYDPYGRRAKVSGDLDSDFAFTGHYYHSISGLDLTLYRAYDADTGKWLTRDPIPERGGMNLYAYVDNNPINYIDLSGLAPGDPYPTANAAAIQAIKDINPTSIQADKEYAGKIYQNPEDKTFSYTKPIPGDKTSSDPGDCPPGKKDAGSYHTHGAYDPNYKNERFSKRDKRIEDKAGTPGYLGTPSGVIMKYTPIPGKPLAGKVVIIGIGAK
jgi:RHS repeat-associated protein